MRQSFQEPFAQPGSLPTFRTFSSGKTFLTKHCEFQSELALASHGLGTRTFLTEDEKRDKTSQTKPQIPSAAVMEYAMSTSQHSPLSSDLAGMGAADGCLLTVDEVAAILRVPRSWVYSHLSQLPVIRLGRYVRFKRSEVERFLENRGPCQ